MLSVYAASYPPPSLKPRIETRVHQAGGDLAFFAFLLLFPLFFRSLSSENVLFVFALFIMSLWLIRDRTGYKLSLLSEHDKVIRFQAAMIAIHAFGATVAIYAIILYLIHRLTLQVPLHQVLLLATYSWLCLYLFWSAFILILQKRGPLKI